MDKKHPNLVGKPLRKNEYGLGFEKIRKVNKVPENTRSEHARNPESHQKRKSTLNLKGGLAELGGFIADYWKLLKEG
jgi:hypothetical protein